MSILPSWRPSWNGKVREAERASGGDRFLYPILAKYDIGQLCAGQSKGRLTNFLWRNGGRI